MAVDIVGRAEELEELNRFLRREAAAGLAALVLEGEPGIGKSTLWLTGVEAARERGIRVLSSRPAEVELEVAHAGLGDLLEDALGDVLPALPPPRRVALEVALLLRDGADEPVDFGAVAVAVRTALQLLAAREPILVAIDDVQWLDPTSTSALAFALRRLVDEDIRILLACRLGDGIPASELERAIDSRTTRLRVGPLSPGALHAILQRRLNTAFARPTLLRIHETSGGNPLFALELARALGPGGGGGDPTRLLPVPDALAELVRGRLAGLPEQTRAALLIVAAAGRPTRALLRAAGVDDPALEPALQAGVIAPADDGVRFTHPLLGSVLYQGAAGGERRQAHRVLASVVDDPIARARHLALGTDLPDSDTAATLDAAAVLALARGAPMVAAELGEHAVRVTLEGVQGDRHRRSLAAARAHLAAGDDSRALVIVQGLLGETPGGPARSEALALAADLQGLEQAVGSLDEALLEAASHPALQAKIYQRLAGCGRLTRGGAWAEVHARAALRIAEELDDDLLRAGALSALAVLRFDLGEPDAPKLAERAHELASAGGDREQLNKVSSALRHILVFSVDTDRARALLEQQYEEERYRDERESIESLWYLSVVEIHAGRWQLAAQHAERCLDVGSQYGMTFPQLYFPAALIAAHRGELERATEFCARARELAGMEGELFAGIVPLGGLIALARGDPSSAISSFASAEEGADAAGWGEPNLRFWRADYVEALLELGRIADGVVLLADWEKAARRVDRTWVLAQANRCRGLVAAAQGDVELAISVLEQAIVSHGEVGDPFGRARALLALGVTRRRARQKRPARGAIEAALAGFEALGAAGWAEKARAELGRIGGRTRVEGLTPAERRVAALVAEGRTNREVAAALFLAERTVSSHLSHVYAKLGVRSRTELARKLPTF